MRPPLLPTAFLLLSLGPTKSYGFSCAPCMHLPPRACVSLAHGIHVSALASSRLSPTALRGGSSDDVVSGEKQIKPEHADYFVQYVLVRKDLQWPAGSIVAQGCHAVTKVLWEHREHKNVIEYCSEINAMHKVVLGVKDEKQLEKFASRLEEAGLIHCIWLEQPENIATALATLPYPKSTIGPLLKKLPLLQ